MIAGILGLMLAAGSGAYFGHAAYILATWPTPSMGADRIVEGE